MRKLTILLVILVAVQVALIAHLVRYNHHLQIRNDNQYRIIEELEKGGNS